MAGIKGRSGGHNKKTLREKQLLGVKKERINDNAPSYLPARVDKIDGLGEVGLTIWNRYEPMLHNNGTLSEVDGMAFYMLCKKWELWYNAAMEVATGNDEFIKREIAYFKQLQSSMRSFGLTPVDRGSVERITREKKVNKFAGLT